VAKAKWRAKHQNEGWGPEDTVDSELYLLGLLTHASPGAVRGYFEKNMFLGRTPPRTREIQHRIFNKSIGNRKKFVFFEEFQMAFRDFQGVIPP